MALQGGHRFPVTMFEAFPHGLYAMGVEQAQDYNEKTGKRTNAKDVKTGELVWTVSCIDRDPDARTKDVKIKVLAPRCPDLPDEILPGTGLRAVEFSGLVVTPWLQEGRAGTRPQLQYSFRATGVHPQGKAPTGPASGRAASGPASPGDKAA